MNAQSRENSRFDLRFAREPPRSTLLGPMPPRVGSCRVTGGESGLKYRRRPLWMRSKPQTCVDRIFVLLCYAIENLMSSIDVRWTSD